MIISFWLQNLLAIFSYSLALRTSKNTFKKIKIKKRQAPNIVISHLSLPLCCRLRLSAPPTPSSSSLIISTSIISNFRLMKKLKKKKFRKIWFTFRLREGYQCQEVIKADERWRHDNIEKGKKYEKIENMRNSCWHFYFFVSVSWLSFLVHQ